MSPNSLNSQSIKSSYFTFSHFIKQLFPHSSPVLIPIRNSVNSQGGGRDLHGGADRGADGGHHPPRRGHLPHRLAPPAVQELRLTPGQSARWPPAPALVQRQQLRHGGEVRGALLRPGRPRARHRVAHGRQTRGLPGALPGPQVRALLQLQHRRHGLSC